MAGIALELGFAFAVLYWPPLSKALDTGPVALRFVALAALGAPLFLVVDIARKRWLPTS